MRVFAYKVVRDFGFAPNPFQRYCTLATCKPNVRGRAQVGDLVLGCGTVGRLPGHVLYAMRVTEKLTFSAYWEDVRFERKRPSLTHNKARSFGDNIYHRDGVGSWIQANSHHSHDDGTRNDINVQRDTSVDAVLISSDFVYWGERALQFPPALQGTVLPRDYFSSFSPTVVRDVDEWFQGLGSRGRLGMPADW